MSETTGFAATSAAAGIGIEQARKTLGEIVDQAYHHGVTTYLTRNGRHVAALAPLDRVDHQPQRRGTAQRDARSRTIAVTPEYTSPGERGAFVIDYDRPMDGYLTHALAREGWTLANPDDFFRLRDGKTVAVVHVPHPPGQAEQLAEWIARYGDRTAAVRGLPNGRIRYLVAETDTVIEGDAIVLETADPNGALFQRATWPGVGGTLADKINGVQRPDGEAGPDGDFDPMGPLSDAEA